MNDYRDSILHIYSWTVIPKKFASEEIFYTELSGFNELFSDPLTDKEVRSKAKTNFKKFTSQALRKNAIKEYEPYERYKFKNETIIKLLNMTVEEQRQMGTIISTDIKYERNNTRIILHFALRLHNAGSLYNT